MPLCAKCRYVYGSTEGCCKKPAPPRPPEMTPLYITAARITGDPADVLVQIRDDGGRIVGHLCGLTHISLNVSEGIDNPTARLAVKLVDKEALIKK